MADYRAGTKYKMSLEHSVPETMKSSKDNRYVSEGHIIS